MCMCIYSSTITIDVLKMDIESMEWQFIEHEAYIYMHACMHTYIYAYLLRYSTYYTHIHILKYIMYTHAYVQ